MHGSKILCKVWLRTQIRTFEAENAHAWRKRSTVLIERKVYPGNFELKVRHNESVVEI